MKRVVISILGLKLCVSSLEADQTLSHQKGLDFARQAHEAETGTGSVSESLASDIIPSYTRDPGDMAQRPEVQEVTALVKERVQDQLSGSRQQIDPNTDPMFVNANQALERPDESLQKQTVTFVEEDDYTEESCIETRDEEFEMTRSCSLDPFYKRFEVSQFYNHCPNHSGWGKTIAKGCWAWKKTDLLRPTRNPSADYEEVHGMDWKSESHPDFETLFQSGKCALKREVATEEGKSSRMVPVMFYKKEETREDWSLTKIEESREGSARLKRPEDFGVESFTKVQVYACSHRAPGNTCKPLRARGGIEKESTCQEWMGTVCVKWKKTYKVPKPGTMKTITTETPSKHSFNTDFYKNDTPSDPNTEGPEAIAKLSALRDVGASLPKTGTDDPNNLSVFNGEDRRCVRQGGNNRCPGGRGKKETGDQILEKLVHEGKCIRVGTYQEKNKNIGTSIGQKREVTTFCCYESVLSKTLHQGALDQGIKSLGDPKSPQCHPLTMGQLQAMNWDRVDFTPFVQETLSKVNLEAVAVAKKSAAQIQSHLSNQVTAAKRAQAQGRSNP